MKRIEIEGCSVDILPIIKGLVSDADAVRKALEEGYDAVGAALGPEDIVALAGRKEILETDGAELSDLDIVYSHFLGRYGDVEFPSPAYSVLVDECLSGSVSLIPLDMDDETYSELYCDTVTAMELLKESKLAKKLLAKGFDCGTAEEFVLEWDSRISRIKGFDVLNGEREAFVSDSIRRAARGKRRMLAVVDLERADGIVECLTGDSLDL